MISLMEYSSRIIDASSNRLDDEISQNGVNEVEWSDVRVDPRPSPHNLIPFSLPCNAIFDNLLESKSAINAERSVMCWELVLHSHCCIPILYSSGISVSSPLYLFFSFFFSFFLFFSFSFSLSFILYIRTYYLSTLLIYIFHSTFYPSCLSPSCYHLSTSLLSHNDPFSLQAMGIDIAEGEMRRVSCIFRSNL